LQIVPSLQKYQITFEIDFTDSNLQKQLKRANKKKALMCLLISSYEVDSKSITIKWLQEYQQKNYHITDFLNNLKNIKQIYY
jgi:histidyl-tRNA synthetase